MYHKLKFEDYKNCLEAAQIKNEINHLEKRKSWRILKNNRLILKTQQRFRSEKQNVFTEEINKIALSASGDKRMESIDSIETYGHWTSKDLVCKK